MSYAAPARQQDHKRLGNRKRLRRGQLMTMTAMLFPLLLGFMGLSLDIGYIYHIKRRMQTAADAGALGGAKELWRVNNSLVTNEAKYDSSLNGFTDGTGGVTVTVNNPPASGAYAGNAGFVEVIIDEPVPTYFMRIINQSSATVRARSVAGLVAATQACVIALDPTQKGSLTVQGTSTLTASCGVMVNSNNTNAIVANGGGCVYSNSVGVTGNWVGNGSSNCVFPPPIADVPPALDPLAYLTPPPMPATPIATNENIISGTVTLNPGLYSGGIVISGGTVTFEPGVYILDGGGLQISGNAVIQNDTGASPGGVMFYNTNSNVGLGTWGIFKITGTVTATLNAPTSGPYAGVLLWDAANAPNKPPGNAIAGTSSSSYTGAMYFPSTQVTYTGTSAVNSWQMLVADTITVSGTSTVTGYYSGSGVPPPTRVASLVE